jgi:hypothetical protein
LIPARFEILVSHPRAKKQRLEMKAVSISLNPVNVLIITVADVISVNKIIMTVRGKNFRGIHFSNCLLNVSMKNAKPVPMMRMTIVNKIL